MRQVLYTFRFCDSPTNTWGKKLEIDRSDLDSFPGTRSCICSLPSRFKGHFLQVFISFSILTFCCSVSECGLSESGEVVRNKCSLLLFSTAWNISVQEPLQTEALFSEVKWWMLSSVIGYHPVIFHTFQVTLHVFELWTPSCFTWHIFRFFLKVNETHSAGPKSNFLDRCAIFC